MTASMLGLGALLATSAAVFTVLKWVGAAYLIWLGIKLWRAPIATEAADGTMSVPAERPLRIFLHTYVITALNPKSIVFFVAFLPQFLDLSRPLFNQMMIFETTFLVLATLNATLYALMASAARQTIRKPQSSGHRQPHGRVAFDRRGPSDGRFAARRHLKKRPTLAVQRLIG